MPTEPLRAPGVRLEAGGARFTLFSYTATAVDLVLLKGAADHEPLTVPLKRGSGPLWHAFVPDLKAGQLYGYRVHGPWDPRQGQRCNPAKVLLDPYARAIGRPLQWQPALHGQLRGPRSGGGGRRDRHDSADSAPLGMLVDDSFDWQDVPRPATPATETVLYETHVKGFTRLHPDVPAAQRGTYLGVSSPPVIEHLQELGVTAVQLLPVHAFVNDERLVAQGLSQYWGYNTLGFFAPEPSYASDGDGHHAVTEFKTMVRELHRAGLEVILDVVFNHTGEGNQLGPTLSFRGIDNRAYYRLKGERPDLYLDHTGTGNTLNAGEPFVLQLLLDSLRYWVQEMGVDGFRFDLAVALGRQNGGFDPQAALFQAVQQDPLLANTKLYAEPWDLGPQGYQAGSFSWRWAEWNGQYRDTVRSYWLGHSGLQAELATRLSGSSDLYAHNGRAPAASVNFVTAHDGFTLLDLVSYEHKHNAANGEDNRDGSDHNLSQNCGVEGPSEDPAVNSRRDRLRRGLLATLLVSHGTPLLLGGDELGRTQQGNNNAYCQDNEVSWFDWKLTERDRDFLAFTRQLLRFRREQPALSRISWLNGEPDTDGKRDATWWNSQGEEMHGEDWNGNGGAFALLLNAPLQKDGRRAAPLLLVIHGHKAGPFRFPAFPGGEWQFEWTSGTPTVFSDGIFIPGSSVTLDAFALSAFTAARNNS